LTHSAKGNRFHPDIFTFGGILQGQRIGYVRVSSFDQNPDRQLEQIEVGKVFTDKASGKDTSVPNLKGCWPSSARATPWWCIAWTVGAQP
jgi:hypothetical protein